VDEEGFEASLRVAVFCFKHRGMGRVLDLGVLASNAVSPDGGSFLVM
jgi:hypothetical protein